MMSIGYLTICIPDNREKKFVHCFKIPQFVDAEYFTKPEPPGPPNFPELELAGTILALVDHVEPLVKDKAFTKELTDVTNKFIQKVREGLPEGVEIKRVKPVQAKAA